MASSEFIEVLSPSAFSDVQKLAQEIDKVVVKVNEANRAFKVIQLPSSGKQLVNENEQISHSIVDLTKQTNQLTQARTKASQKTSEEIVNSRILRQNADLEARATSSLAGEYQKLTARRAQSAKSLQDLVVRGKLAGQSQREYNRELRNAQREYDKLDGKVIQANRAINRFNDNVGNYPKKAVSGLRDLIGAFGVIGGVTAVAAITKDIFNTTRELQSMDLALKQVIGTEEDFAQTQQFLSRISEAYGAEIKGLTKSFTSFYVSARDKLERGEIEQIFESITKSAGAMGLSVEQQEGTFLALTQMISKGTVQAEELRGQLSERLPGAFGILAKSMGVTEKQLNKMLEQGQVMAADVLPKFAKELEKAYGVETLDRVETLNASTARLSNSWTDFIREINEGSGPVTRFFSWFVDGAAQALDALGDLIQSKESLMKENADTAKGRGFQDATNLIKESADAGAGSMKDWAESIKNLVEPKIKQMNEELKQQRWILKNSDNAWYKYFNASSWKQNSDSRKRIKELNEEIAYNEGRLDAANKVLAGTAPTKEKDIELTDEQKKALQKLREEREKDIYTLKRLRLETERQVTKNLMDNDKMYYSDKEKYAVEYMQRELDIADLTRKEGLRQAGDNSVKQQIVWEQYYQDFIRITKEGEDRVLKLREQYFDDFKAYSEKFKGEGLNVLSTEDLADDFFKKQADDAAKAREEVDRLKQSVNEYLTQFTQGFLGDMGFSALFDIMSDKVPEFGKNFATTFTAVTEVAQEAFAFLNQNQQAYFDAQLYRAQQEKDISLQFAGENAAGREEIERQYEERVREIRRREAEAQKNTAIFNAVINTAQGVTAALAQGPTGIPLSVVIGLLGAAQIALISSRQIPQYEFGTANHPGGRMMVNDAKGSNYREMVIEPGKVPYIPEKRNAIINAPKGTKVLTAKDTMRELNGMLYDNTIAWSNGQIPYPMHLLHQMPRVEINNGGGMTEAQMERVMKKTLGGMATVTNVFDKDGFSNYVGTTAAKHQQLNNIIHSKGIQL